MHRVLKPAGLAHFGVMSYDSWPHSEYGEERRKGEFWIGEEGEEECHSFFTDDQIEPLLTSWNVLSKVRSTLHFRGDHLSEDAWAKLHSEAPMACTPGEWKAAYIRRMDFLRLVYVLFVVEKTA
jgi:hypothetical protein